MSRLQHLPQWIGALTIAFILQGCGVLQPPSSTSDSAANETHSGSAEEQTAHGTVQLNNVPFFAQKEYQCGPAALAMVLKQRGANLKPDDLTEQVYLPTREGSLQIEMLATTRRQGYLPYVIDPNFEGILNALKANSPVVVLLNMSLPVYPMWHYAVVTGYDASSQTVILHSGEKANDRIGLYTFKQLWQRSQNWGFIALDPTLTPPDFSQVEPYTQSISALERLEPKKAFAAWLQASVKWPDHAPVQLALGNAFFNQKNYLSAEKAYLRAVRLNPRFADAWNNLAEAQWAQNKTKAAKQSLQKALEIGGEHADVYKQTNKKFRNGR